MKKVNPGFQQLPKCPTGIRGFEEITFGGLPRGRTTLVAGSAGSGKTLFGIEFLVKGASEFDENGVFMAFEETDKELVDNVSSLGFRLDELIRKKKVFIDHIHLEPKEIEETGEYDLEGLFIRLNYAIDSVGAKRVVLDTIETLFSGFSNPLILRAELRRLFRWLKDKGVTAIITGERGDNSITRQGLEEYVSDCVIVLDHRVSDESSTRRMRVVKYRGSAHGTNEYPFLIDENGFSVLPITSVGLNHEVSFERVSSGIKELDQMLGGKGFFKGSSILISGSAGTGKSSLAAQSAQGACQRGEKVIYITLEESPQQLIRNMKSIGMSLEKYSDNGLLVFQAMRPTMTSLEMHLTGIHKLIEREKPSLVIIDPLNSFVTSNNQLEAKSMAMRLIDYLKGKGITGLFTFLSHVNDDSEHNFISSLIDTWILLREQESDGERNRAIYILKSRGMAHSNQIREFLLTSNGIKLVDVFKSTGGVLTGSSRVAQEIKNREDNIKQLNDIEQLKRTLQRKKKALNSRIDAMKAEHKAEEEELRKELAREQERTSRLEKDTESERNKKTGSRKKTKK